MILETPCHSAGLAAGRLALQLAPAWTRYYISLRINDNIRKRISGREFALQAPPAALEWSGLQGEKTSSSTAAST